MLHIPDLLPEAVAVFHGLTRPFLGGRLNSRTCARQTQVHLAIHPAGAGDGLGLAGPAVHVVDHLIHGHILDQGDGSRRFRHHFQADLSHHAQSTHGASV